MFDLNSSQYPECHLAVKKLKKFVNLFSFGHWCNPIRCLQFISVRCQFAIRFIRIDLNNLMKTIVKSFMRKSLKMKSFDQIRFDHNLFSYLHPKSMN